MEVESFLPNFLKTSELVLYLFDTFDFARLNQQTSAKTIDEVVQGLRVLSMKPDYSESFTALLHHQRSLSALCDVLISSTSRLKLSNGAYDELEVQIICNTLWTLQNLSFEAGVSDNLLHNLKLHEITIKIFLDHFIYPATSQNIYEPGHYPKQIKLQPVQLKLLNELLWHTANLL
jgi:hypothetical protein